MLNLSPKAIRCIVEALEVQVASYQTQLERGDLADDQAADVTNDLMFLEALLQDLKQALARPMAQIF